jgi:hypothetical protein
MAERRLSPCAHVPLQSSEVVEYLSDVDELVRGTGRIQLRRSCSGVWKQDRSCFLLQFRAQILHFMMN